LGKDSDANRRDISYFFETGRCAAFTVTRQVPTMKSSLEEFPVRDSRPEGGREKIRNKLRGFHGRDGVPG
jgi:hypothetical protein